MAEIRVTRRKDGVSSILQDNGTTRKHINAHNRVSKEENKWDVDDVNAPARLTVSQQLAQLQAENNALKSQMLSNGHSSGIPDIDISMNYTADKAIMLINMIDNIKELNDFTKGETRKGVNFAIAEKEKQIYGS